MKQYQNIKNQILNIKNTIQGSKIFEFCFVILIFAFLFLNFSLSQFISPIYFQFVNNNKASAVNFLQKINNLPEYKRILEMNNNIYGSTIKEQIFAKNNIKKEMIKNLEQKLTINPKSRDVLYGLYQLYLEEGDKNQANDFLRRAKEVDPTIN
ncbi:MAG: tetratricopeptide repeat protein [Patescibacteria group bacterium]|jgi:tetratricopeptide (TPR) repeat protein